MQHLTKYYYCLTFLVFVYGLLAARVWLKSVVTVWPVQSVQGMRLIECNVVVSQLGIVCGRRPLQRRSRWALFCSTLIVLTSLLSSAGPFCGWTLPITAVLHGILLLQNRTES